MIDCLVPQQIPILSSSYSNSSSQSSPRHIDDAIPVKQKLNSKKSVNKLTMLFLNPAHHFKFSLL